MSSHAVRQDNSHDQTKSLEPLLNGSFLNQPRCLRKMSGKVLNGLSLDYFQTNHCLNGIIGLFESFGQFAIIVDGRGKVTST